MAQEVQAARILIDDRDASRAARARGLTVVGTLALLDEAAERGLIPDLPRTLERLTNDTNFRVSKATDQIIRDMLQRDQDRKRAREQKPDGVSLAVEAVLIVVARLKVPEDNAVLAPIVLTAPPLLAAVFSGFRRPVRDLWTVAALASILTLLITAVVTRLTGVSMGLAEPLLNRSIAGWLGAWITNRVSTRRG